MFSLIILTWPQLLKFDVQTHACNHVYPRSERKSDLARSAAVHRSKVYVQCELQGNVVSVYHVVSHSLFRRSESPGLFVCCVCVLVQCDSIYCTCRGIPSEIIFTVYLLLKSSCFKLWQKADRRSFFRIEEIEIQLPPKT